MTTIRQRAYDIANTFLKPSASSYLPLVDVVELAIEAAVAEAQRWIPVAERLPPGGDEAMVMSGDGTYWFATYQEGLWWVVYDDSSEDVIGGITHWYPIPVPPEDAP